MNSKHMLDINKRSMIYFVASLIPKVYFSLYRHKVKFLNCMPECLMCEMSYSKDIGNSHTKRCQHCLQRRSLT